MAMELKVLNREKFKKAVHSLRREGLIPAELYGHGIENKHLSVPSKEFRKLFREAGTNTVVDLVLDGKKSNVLIHDVGMDYLSGEFTHIDFYEVRMDQKLKARIPIEFSGEAPAVKEKGYILNAVISDVEVEALPGDLPHRLVAELGSLDDAGKSIYIKDIKVSKGVRIVTDPEMAVATITLPIVEEKVEEPVEASEVKVETEEKKAERESEKETKKTEGEAK